MALSKYHRGFVYMIGSAFVELCFTGIRRWPNLEGRTQLWVLPLYYFGSIYGLEPIYQRFRHQYRLVRLFIYAMAFLGIEFVAGWILHRYLGQCPWEYKGRKLSVWGYVDLAYAPLWALLGLAGEMTYELLTSYRLIRTELGTVPFQLSVEQMLDATH